MLPAGFEPAIPANEGPQTYALDRAATGIGPDIRIVFDTVVLEHMEGFIFFILLQFMQWIVYLKFLQKTSWSRFLLDKLIVAQSNLRVGL
jgi:hypothetical protein